MPRRKKKSIQIDSVPSQALVHGKSTVHTSDLVGAENGVSTRHNKNVGVRRVLAKLHPLTTLNSAGNINPMIVEIGRHDPVLLSIMLRARYVEMDPSAFNSVEELEETHLVEELSLNAGSAIGKCSKRCDFPNEWNEIGEETIMANMSEKEPPSDSFILADILDEAEIHKRKKRCYGKSDIFSYCSTQLADDEVVSNALETRGVENNRKNHLTKGEHGVLSHAALLWLSKKMERAWHLLSASRSNHICLNTREAPIGAISTAEIPKYRFKASINLFFDKRCELGTYETADAAGETYDKSAIGRRVLALILKEGLRLQKRIEARKASYNYTFQTLAEQSNNSSTSIDIAAQNASAAALSATQQCVLYHNKYSAWMEDSVLYPELNISYSIWNAGMINETIQFDYGDEPYPVKDISTRDEVIRLGDSMIDGEPNLSPSKELISMLRDTLLCKFQESNVGYDSCVVKKCEEKVECEAVLRRSDPEKQSAQSEYQTNACPVASIAFSSPSIPSSAEHIQQLEHQLALLSGTILERANNIGTIIRLEQSLMPLVRMKEMFQHEVTSHFLADKANEVCDDDSKL